MTAAGRTTPAGGDVFRAVTDLELTASAGVVIVTAPGIGLALDPHGAFARALASLASPRTIEEVALASGLPVAAARDLVTTLYAEGLVEDDSDRPLPGEVFLDHLRARGRSWERQRDGARQLMNAWRDDAASRGLGAGFLVEEWHHIRATPTLITALLRAPGTLVQRDRWAALIESERRAEREIAAALQHLRHTVRVDVARELGTGRALRTGLLQCARHGTLDYLACTAPFGHSRAGLEGKLDFLCSLPWHGIPDAVVAPFLDRAHAFLAAGLDDLVAACFVAAPDLSRERRHQLLTRLQAHVALSDAFYLDLLQVYGTATSPGA